MSDPLTIRCPNGAALIVAAAFEFGAGVFSDHADRRDLLTRAATGFEPVGDGEHADLTFDRGEWKRLLAYLVGSVDRVNDPRSKAASLIRAGLGIPDPFDPAAVREARKAK